MWKEHNTLTKLSTSHNDLTTRQTLLLTPPPFYHTHDTTTYNYLLGKTQLCVRNMRATNPILRDKPQKRVQGEGELQQKGITNAHPRLTHIAITTSLTSSSSYLLPSYPQSSSPTPWIQKHTPFPSQQERQATTKKEGWKFFFPSKKSQTTELFGSMC